MTTIRVINIGQPEQHEAWKGAIDVAAVRVPDDEEEPPTPSNTNAKEPSPKSTYTECSSPPQNAFFRLLRFVGLGIAYGISLALSCLEGAPSQGAAVFRKDFAHQTAGQKYPDFESFAQSKRVG